MWNLSGPGIEPISPTSAVGFLSIAPPGKSKTLLKNSLIVLLGPRAILRQQKSRGLEARQILDLNLVSIIPSSPSSHKYILSECLLCQTLFCDWGFSGGNVHPGLNARLLHPWDFPATIVECAAISFSRRSSQPRDRSQVSCIAGKLFTQHLSPQGIPNE